MKLHFAALAIVALAAPAVLAAQDIDVKLDQALVENFDDPAVIEEAFVPLQATTTKRITDSGELSVDFKFPNGLAGNAEASACKDQELQKGCVALSFTSFYQRPEGKTAAEVAELVNGFNISHPAVQVVYDTTGKTRLTYYLAADFGITRTNLAMQVFRFRLNATDWANALFPPPPTTK